MKRKIVWLLLAVAALALAACKDAGGQKAPETTTLIYAVLSAEGVHRADVNRCTQTHMHDGVPL